MFFDGDMIFDASQLQTLYNELRSMLPNNVKPVAKRRKKRRIIDFASHNESLWSKGINYFIDDHDDNSFYGSMYTFSVNSSLL